MPMTEKIYLHSTMLLFQPVEQSGGERAIFIYIPLCFYFNEKYGWGMVLDWIFTFHYASISTDLHAGAPF